LRAELNIESQSYSKNLLKLVRDCKNLDIREFLVQEAIKFNEYFETKTNEDMLFKLPLDQLNAFARVLPDTPETSHLLQRHIMRYRKTEDFDIH
jgi:hypothetical protein